MIWLTMLWGCAEEAAEQAVPAPEKTVERVPTPPPARPPNALGQSVQDLGVDDWVVSKAGEAGSGVKLVVFWELWCPHCRREVPKLQALHEKLGERLEVVGLTRLTRNTPRADVASFVEKQNVSYPVGIGGHDLANRLGVRGIPSAVVVKDGTVVWSGHPASLDETQLESWL